MQPAADAMAEALSGIQINAPSAPLVANVRAEAVTDPDVIRLLLVEQITGRVRWRESVAWMSDNGVEQFVEVGAGKALSGMIRRISRQADVAAVGKPADVAGFVEKIGGANV